MEPDRVVVINDLSQAKGGATGLALLSAREFDRTGLEVTYVCGDTGQGAEAGGAHVVAAGQSGLLKRNPLHAGLHGLYNPATRDMLADFIARTDTPRTGYHLHGWAQILSPSVFDALAPVASRTLIHAHDMFLACPNGVYMDYPHETVCSRVPMSRACVLTNCDKRSRLHKAWRLMRQRALRRAFRPELPWAGIVAIHPEMLPRLARAGYPDSMFHVVRNPAEPFSGQRIGAEDNQRLAFVGRLERDKGALDLAHAAERVGMAVTYVGDGSLRPELEGRGKDTRVTGWQDRTAIGALLQDARALVMPSRHPEPFALVLPEAILSGLPVAVADTALMATEIARTGLGEPFSVFDAASMDAALIRLRDMPRNQVLDISMRGHAAGRKLAHTTESWVAALLDLYRRLV